MNDKTQTGKSRLIIVSNRLSVRVEREAEGYAYHPTVGGLATSLSRLNQDTEMLWVGWPGITGADPQECRLIEAGLRQQFGAVPVFLTDEQLELYYDGFSNGAIWPLFHYFSRYAHYDAAEWQAYQEVNRLFRDKVLEIARPNDTLWIQDYHLMLLPALIREALPEARIGFFLHIPFPSYEIYRYLPWRTEILEGLLGADLIGFHTYGYTRHFLSSLLRLLGLEQEFGQVMVEGRPVNVETFPLGIDVDRFARAAEDPATVTELEDLRRRIGGGKVILSVDRLDFTKGIPERLQSYGRFLEQYPEWRGQVTLIAIAVPSRVRVAEYQALKREVDELVGRINGQFGQPGWTPIWYLYRSLPFAQLVPMYRLADVALVTPIRDGMNLVAKEYLAARTDETGALVLSETAGAAEELSEALIVNPYDEQGMVEALLEALQMPVNEQRARIRPMQTRLRRYNTARWASDFLMRLEATAELYLSFKQEHLVGPLRQELLSCYRQSKRRLILLDYDGTLVPFARKPGQARPDPGLVGELQQLRSDPRNTVVVISGRDYVTLKQWLGDAGVNLVAEHGARVLLAGETEWLLADVGRSEEWKAQLEPLLQVYADRTPGALVEEKQGGLAWHYRGADPEIGSLRAKELVDALEGFVANTSLQLMLGNKVIEVKSSNISKGTAVQRWLNQQPGFDFILAIGDDVTDEYLFAELPDDSWTVKVGQARNSRARFYVSGTYEVRRLVQDLLKAK